MALFFSAKTTSIIKTITITITSIIMIIILLGDQ